MGSGFADVAVAKMPDAREVIYKLKESVWNSV